MKRPAWLPDNFVLLLLATVALAALLPVQGRGVVVLDGLTQAAVALLFFLHGSKLSRRAVWEGLLHWRLHALVFAATFALFPLLGLVLRPWLEPLVGPTLYLGVLFICALPSTVQSSIAFTSVARGNVAAAMCSASTSNILGMALTPLLMAGMARWVGGAAEAGAVQLSWHTFQGIVGTLLLPFAAGQALQGWTGAWVARHKAWVRVSDQGTILLVVYGAFSAATVQGLYRHLPPATLLALLGICALLLALVMPLLMLVSRRLGFSREDEIAIVFCGSKKTLASGVPMAQILFAGQAVGLLVLPLMLFHQLQLMVCAPLARRYAVGPRPAPALQR
ncbi:bile acid:sodium symporter family protein [Roseateles sp.]|uniref:bile acid:sodium symporter family protein n=1 Tax=Roseateles sp. TaxID=1971397 RepID=UPI0025F8C9AA|nr:bile acid:sodium symporter family protein [Roseateles sp.]MBV8037378.1 bile acid:sodium symporter [Roseateles sp.]